MSRPTLALVAVLTLFTARLAAQDGYRLWLRYDPIPDEAVRRADAAAITEIVVTEPPAPAFGPGREQLAAARDELVAGLRGLLEVSGRFQIHQPATPP